MTALPHVHSGQDPRGKWERKSLKFTAVKFSDNREELLAAPVPFCLSLAGYDLWCVWNLICVAVVPQITTSQWIINPERVLWMCLWGGGIVFQEEYQSICYLPVRLLRCAEGVRGAVHGGAGLKVEGVHRESSRAKTWICKLHLLKSLSIFVPSSYLCDHFSLLLSLISPVYNRSAQVPGHQLISRPPWQCPHFCQKAPTNGRPGAPNRGPPTHVQEECQLCEDSRAQGAGAGWKHLYCPVFGNWWVLLMKSQQITCKKTINNNKLRLLKSFAAIFWYSCRPIWVAA